MVIDFTPAIANSNQFPPAEVLASPKFYLSDINPYQRILKHSHNLLFTKNGRGAIGLAGSRLKKPGINTILIPAYHCPALVEPFIWLGYQIKFYPINDDLSTDISILEDMLQKNAITHGIVIRYFGFNQNADNVIALLKKRNVTVIEDCAHALFKLIDNLEGQALQADACISSINKLLPTLDGGLLTINKHLPLPLAQCSWMQESKAAAYLIGITKYIEQIKNKLLPSPVPSVQINDIDISETIPEFRYFSPNDIHSASYRHTRFILFKSKFESIKNQRRAVFRYLVDNINNPAAGQLLYKDCQKDVPYVLPFLLNDSKHFSSLREKRIQVLRWEEIAASGCKISNQYRTNLVQLPCHHQLTLSELDYIIETINALN